VRPLVDVLVDLLARYDASWSKLTTAQVFDRLAGENPAFAGLSWDDLPAVGVTLNVPQARAALDAATASAVQEV
jgi:predicted molibdopterin-dependent oxidoreductase YjgC